MEIRKATKAELNFVYQLIKELAIFENALDKVLISEQEFIDDADSNWYECLVAVCDDKIVGAAVYFKSYSTWKGKMVYLQDLIVTQEFRNRGIGTALLNELLNASEKIGAKIVFWQVLDWNTDAIEFYKKYNAEFDKGWLNVKVKPSFRKVN